MQTAQVTTATYVSDILYWVGTAATILAVVGLLLIDLGFVRRRYSLDTVLKRLAAGLLGAASFLIVGNAIWYWQFNQAFGVSSPFWSSVKHWWIGGDWMRQFAQNINPNALPDADTQQIFVVFFASFAAIVVILLLSGGLERARASVTYVSAIVVGGIVLPVLLYLTWGPLGPLTVRGVHDFLGVYAGYILAGTWALVLAWRLGPRHLRADEPAAIGQNYPLVVLGIGVLLTSVPLFAVSCGFLIPGSGYFGINMSTSGFGIVVLNTFAGIFGGTIAGLILGYRLKAAQWVLFGPVAGYVAVGASLDVTRPWVAAILGFLGLFVAFGADRIMHAVEIDEHKVVPLGLGVGTFSVLATGVVAWGARVGGYPGLTGHYRFHVAEINLGWQAIGLLVTLAIGFGSALIVILSLEKTVGIRVSAEEDELGQDAVIWQAPLWDPVAEVRAGEPVAVEAGVAEGDE